MIQTLRTRGLRMFVGAAAIFVVGAGVAWAAIPGSTGVINGCYGERTGILRVIDSEADAACLNSETPISWSQQGPQGERGPQGPQGLKGDTGNAGPQGPQGLKGDTGATGPQGVKGDTGDTGPEGLRGETGLPGPSDAYVSESDESLAQFPAVWRMALGKSLPPGRYVIFANVMVTTVAPWPAEASAVCRLNAENEESAEIVLDVAARSGNATIGEIGTLPLMATHEQKTQRTVSVWCRSSLGGSINERELVALKVGAIHP